MSSAAPTAPDHDAPDGPDGPNLCVLVDAMSARLGGGLSFITRQLTALAEQPGVTGRVVAAPWNAEALRAAQPWPVQDTGVRTVAHRYVWEQTVLRRPATLAGADVVYFPANLGPLLALPRPSVLTVQDANYVQAAEWRRANLSRGKQAKQLLVRRSLQVVDEVVFISESLRAQAAAEFPAVARRGTVIHSGGPAWPLDGRPPGYVRTPDLDRGGFVLAVANDYRHKGLDVLVAAWADAMQAHAAAERATGADPVARHLVICGEITLDRLAVLRSLLPTDLAAYPSRLHHLGPVADRRQLRWLVERAAALACPSTLEAYPLTPQEGGLLGCPLLLSDIAAHREVAGGHARFVDPTSVAAWAAAIGEVWTDPPDRTPWETPWSWADNAAALAGVLRRAAARGHTRPTGAGAPR